MTAQVNEQIGAIQYWIGKYKDQLASSRYEVRRLGAIIKRAVADLELCENKEEFSLVTERLDNEMRQLAQCSCGKLWSYDQLQWRPLDEIGLDISECLVCRSTLSRTMVK
jgi:hypothetical protein